MRRGYRSGVRPFTAGVIALVLIAIGTWFAFAKDVPFVDGYRIQAVFKNSNLVGQRSPVRIAGVDVGEVVKVERYRDTQMALVTMEIDDAGRPIHSDATIKIRPRLFLEGNFYLDVQPGTPAGDELADGGLIPATQTSVPVQLDQVLTALQADTRAGLQRTLRGLGAALGSAPAGELSGGAALGRSLETAPGALRDSAIAADALRGEAPRDLSRLIRGLARTSGALARNEQQLGGLISDFNTTMATTASRAPQLEQIVRLLGPTAANANRAFASLSGALPDTRAFAREVLPGVQELPATIAAADPWLDQATALFGPAELGGLLADLGPATRELAGLEHGSLDLLPEFELLSRCATEVLIPTGEIRVEDGEHSAGVENYKELWYAMVGQAGEGQSFDGNGPFLRLGAPGGAQTIQTGRTNYTGLSLFGNATTPPLATRPAFPGTPPPLGRGRPCHRNPQPDVNGPASSGPADGSRPGAAAPPAPPVATESPLSSAARRLTPLASLRAEARP